MASWIPPVDASVSQQYAVKNSSYEAGHHTGIDFSVPGGTRIVAVQNGKVVESGWNDSYGNYVKIKHPNGTFSLYAHLRRRVAEVGDRIRQGQPVGRSGNTGNSTGAHLHFEVRTAPGYGSDINPMQFIPRGATVADADRNRGGKGGGGNDGKGGGGGDKITMAEYGFTKAFLNDHPEIAKMVQRAVNQQWTIDRFQAEIKDTKWWQNKSTAMQQWQIMSSEKPAEAKEQIRTKAVDIHTLAVQMGVNLPKGKAMDLAQKALMTGMSDQEMLSLMAGKFDMTPEELSKKQEKKMTPKEERAYRQQQKAIGTDAITGQAGVTVTGLRQMAEDYGLTVSDRRLEKQVQQVLAGENDVAGLQGYYIKQAKQLYPTLEEELEEGTTVADMLASYQEIAARELGIPADQMDPTNPKWTAALTAGKNGRMTADEWQFALRNEKRYGWDTTSGARQQAADLTAQLAQAFGNVA